METLDLSEALVIARSAADAGALVAMKGREHGHSLRIRTKMITPSVADIFTDVDEEAQRAIVDVIRSSFSDHRILAEEEGEHGGDPVSPYCWIIDPLDGTNSYIHGKNTFGTMVALQENDRAIVGAITVPAKEERFWGAKGMGSFFNCKPVVLRKTLDLEHAILCTNTNAGARLREDGLMAVTAPHCASLQNYGCSACEFGDILKGENDGYFFTGIRLWDGAAAFLLIEEAEGRVAYEFWDPADQRGYIRGVASTAPIFEELRRFVFGVSIPVFPQMS